MRKIVEVSFAQELTEAEDEAKTIDPDAPYNMMKPWEEILPGDNPAGKLEDRYVKQLYVLLEQLRVVSRQANMNLMRRAASEGKQENDPSYAEQRAENFKKVLFLGILERAFYAYLRLAVPEVTMKPTVGLRVGWQVVWREQDMVIHAQPVETERPSRLN